MDHEQYASNLGKVVANFHTLEMLLRVFLAYAHQETVTLPSAVGETLPETNFTSYDSLSEVIMEYNKALSPTEASYKVDPALVNLRNAIAHGRLLTMGETFPLTLYKFGKPPKSTRKVPVERIDVLDEVWFENARNAIRNAHVDIETCAKLRGYW